MKKIFFCLIIGLIFNLNSFAISHSDVISPDSINDGPYIFFVNGGPSGKVD